MKIIKDKKFDGQVFWTYILTYGLGRVWIEGLRTDSLYLGPVRISQIVALVTAIIAVVMLVIGTKKTKTIQYNDENQCE